MDRDENPGVKRETTGDFLIFSADLLDKIKFTAIFIV
jgi:hypothetical protein